MYDKIHHKLKKKKKKKTPSIMASLILGANWALGFPIRLVEFYIILWEAKQLVFSSHIWGFV